MTENNKNDVFNNIVWPKDPILKDQEVWNSNMGVVEFLCTAGTVTKWEEGGAYPKIPYYYDIQGIEVQFLPHWGFYIVASLGFDIPSSIEDVMEVVDLAKKLLAFGLHTQQ